MSGFELARPIFYTVSSGPARHENQAKGSCLDHHPSKWAPQARPVKHGLPCRHVCCWVVLGRTGSGPRSTLSIVSMFSLSSFGWLVRTSSGIMIEPNHFLTKKNFSFRKKLISFFIRIFFFILWLLRTSCRISFFIHKRTYVTVGFAPWNWGQRVDPNNIVHWILVSKLEWFI